jgi:hypothetical protein
VLGAATLLLVAAGSVRALEPPVLDRGTGERAPSADGRDNTETVAARDTAGSDHSGQQQEVGTRPWPEDWFSDLPAVDMSGTWVFDPDSSDPMLSTWQGREVTYEIIQQAAFIILDFKVTGSESNRQRYSWDGTIQRFDRGGRLAEEAARWTDAGRTLEIVGRHWDPETPGERAEYRFTYQLRNDQLVFVQESDSGRTVWRFDRSEGR